MKSNFIATSKPTRFMSEEKQARKASKKALKSSRKLARQSKILSSAWEM